MNQQLRTQLEQSGYLKRPMQPNPEDAGETRWLAKPVLETRRLGLASDFASLRLEGPGVMDVCTERSVSGQGSVRVTLPTALAAKNPTNRAYANSVVYRPLPGEDLSRFNRLSLWLYADAPGFHSVFFSVNLHNEGEHVMPLPGRFEGSHFPAVEPGRWQRVVWEIPRIYRDRVTALSFGVLLMGSLPECADEIRVYVDDLRLEAVEVENDLGFELRRGAIAYCHSGYRRGAAKQALVQGCPEPSFCLLDSRGAEAFRGTAEDAGNGFRRMDFTAVEGPGEYTIYIGGLQSRPFPIGEEAYLAAAWKTLSFFFAERCGADVPGVHTVCHRDVFCVHPDGRKLPVNGGWHDAADVTQGLLNTAESAYAMLELEEAVRDREPSLHERLLEEARWGIGWVIGTRFGDGYRHTGCIIGIWTKNIVGDKDDMEAQAKNLPQENYTAAALCARAARAYEGDAEFSAWCLKCAREDFAFAEKTVEQAAVSEKVVLLAQAAVAAAELYVTTGMAEYLSAGAAYARGVMACQQTEERRDFSLPLKGFFYENEEKKRILAFFHKSYEHAPMQALSLLYRAAQGHAEAGLWQRSMELYGQYIKDTAGLIPPYGLLPNAIYEVGNTDYSGIYHEGDRSVGAPSLEEYNAQVRNGIPLNDTHFLRRFPVAYQFRGFHGTLLAKAKAAFQIDRALGDGALRSIATRQMEWVLGFNPFALSSMYGEGYDYPPLYVALQPQLVGAVPVGFETFENLDLPYFPMQNACTYKEIWVHTTGRVMGLIAELYR